LLREAAQERGRLIKAASDRKAPAVEACKLIASFAHAEIRMIKYLEANSAQCGIPSPVADQLRNSHRNTEKIQQQVCAIAQRGPSTGLGANKLVGLRRRAPAGPVGDFWPASAPPCHQSVVTASRPAACAPARKPGTASEKPDTASEMFHFRALSAQSAGNRSCFWLSGDPRAALLPQSTGC
jgi:hypothetical protein